MLKAMSAMVENLDTQMIDYMVDIDMQVPGFSSEPWLHDEVKMEEDAPGLKLEDFAHVKEDGRDQGDLTIEIDMEEHNSAEYDMVDDEQIPEILDVEVYDASLAHSPAMGVFDSDLPAESTVLPVVVPPTEPQETGVTTVPEPALAAESIATSDSLAPVSEEVVVLPVSDSPPKASHTDETPNTIFSIHQPLTHGPVEPLENATSGELAQPVDPEYPPSTDAAGAESVETRSQEEVFPLPDLQSHVIEDLNSTFVTPDEGLPQETQETSHTDGPHVDSTSSGDPHEISEGVYIDPPPAVLFTISSDDHEHEYSLFNEPAEWQLPSVEQNPDTHRTLLHHLPTMYYESLFSLFAALRQDEFIQSTFPLLEVELVLQAVDLGLTVSEDNVYSRDVSLHDLNILHDGSGIGGPLKTKLYASTPRFIIQYQQLQEHVSRLQLGLQSRGFSFGGQTETHENQQPYLGHTPDHQAVPTEEGEPETALVANGEDSKEPEEQDETVTHLQNSQPNLAADPHDEEEHEDQNGVNQAADPHDEEEHEDQNGVNQAAEKEKDQDFRGDEEESTSVIYPTVEDNDHDSSEGETAVIGLDVLEADVVDPQLAEGDAEDEQDDEASAPLHGGSEERDETEHGSELEFGENPYDAPEGSGPPVADEQDEVNQELEEGDEEGDGFPHEHLEYVEPDADSEPLLDQSQTLLQDVNDHNRSEADVTGIDHTALSGNGDDHEYNEEEPLPELPTDPISFDDGNWEQELEEFGADESWNGGGDVNEHSVSNHSSVTLSSRGSKRTFDEYESGGEGYVEEEEQPLELPGSPDPKRTRTQ